VISTSVVSTSVHPTLAPLMTVVAVKGVPSGALGDGAVGTQLAGEQVQAVAAVAVVDVGASFLRLPAGIDGRLLTPGWTNHPE
jgi:hypothetical protein